MTFQAGWKLLMRDSSSFLTQCCLEDHDSNKAVMHSNLSFEVSGSPAQYQALLSKCTAPLVCLGEGGYPSPEEARCTYSGYSDRQMS